MEFLKNIIATDMFKYAAAAFMALIPVIVWMYVWFKPSEEVKAGAKTKSEESKHMLYVFFLGTLTVLPILGLQWLWSYHPELDVYSYIDSSINNAIVWFTVTYMLAGVLEEIAKGMVIYWVDFSTIQIKTINNCIKYNLLVGLGFAFSENILYFFYGMQSGDLLNLFAVFMFRGAFTVCAHMIFSSIVGYFYGIAR